MLSLGLSLKLQNPDILASRFGYSKYSIAFDGSNDKLASSDATLPTKLAEEGFKGAGAISVWFQIHSSASTNGLIVNCQVDANNRIFVQFKNSDGTVKCNYRGDGTTKSLSISPGTSIKGDGKFHHILFTWASDGNGQSFFDGDSQSTESSIASHNFAADKDFDDAGSVVTMGEAETGSTDLYGYVDNVALLSGTHSVADAVAIYNNGIPADLKGWSNTIVYFEFEEGSGETTKSSVNHHLSYMEIAGATFSTITPTNLS